MIIREANEITIRDADAQRERKLAATQEKITSCMEKIKASGVHGKISQECLEGYFRYLLFADRNEVHLPYHFMIQIVSGESEEPFLENFINAVETLTGRKIVKEEIPELLFLEGKVSKEDLNDTDFLIVKDVLSMDQLQTYVNGKRDDLKAFSNKLPDFLSGLSGISVILCAPEDILEERFHSNEQLYFRFFRNHIKLGKHYSVDQIIQRCFERLQKTGFSMTGRFMEEMTAYICTIYGGADLKDEKFIIDAVERVLTKYYIKDGKTGVIDERSRPFYREIKSEADIDAELESLIGMDRVKDDIHDIRQMVKEPGKYKKRPALHMAFVGNPGTGKTTIAQKMADLLYSMRIIQKNKVVTVSAKDLIGEYVGHTAPKTSRKCREAYGGILFIDEAYMLSTKGYYGNTGMFREECLGTLLQEMENNKDRLIVILAGYPEEMDKMLDSNPGLRSRLYKIVRFDDYTDEELYLIFLNKCTQEGYQLTDEAKERIRFKLSVMRYEKSFGNARTAENCFAEAEREYRKSENNDQVIRAEHILVKTDLKDFRTALSELEGMIGLQSAKAEIKKEISVRKFIQKYDVEVPVSRHMVFTGNPGTGKSTAAELFCQLLFSIGAAKSPNVVSITAGDLLGSTSAAKDLREYCANASGGVLFIDEAYELSGKPTICIECISVLLDVLETQRDSLTVILAGYEKPMREFLQKNQGLQSRFPTMIRFENYKPDELTEIFCQIAAKYGFTISERGIQKFNRIMLTEMQSEFFGNGRTVRTVFEQSFRQHAVNLDANTDGSVKAFELNEDDICLDAAKQQVAEITKIGQL